MADNILKPGRVSAPNFTASMAEAMDKAFLAEWRAVKGTALSGLGEEDRRILLVAIAQGVVAHLQQHAEAIRVEVNVTNTQGEGKAVEIQAEGLMGILSS